VVVHDGYVHREEYAYYLIINGRDVWSRDCDDHHGYHGHRENHERIDAPRVTFKEAVALVWEVLAQEEYLADAGPRIEGDDE
jgi:hypothetical protein